MDKQGKRGSNRRGCWCLKSRVSFEGVRSKLAAIVLLHTLHKKKSESRDCSEANILSLTQDDGIRIVYVNMRRGSTNIHMYDNINLLR